ncbi:M24 family metallopeptidase [Kiloniella laminariae]|uniref:M24 family metallopeptidase n=1 Tax=Kiloniella laminariae TaxID=454162 RepID=UPI0003A8A016|nr:M24 family metallopeptidase [Kiloniella laminariae]
MLKSKDLPFSKNEYDRRISKCRSKMLAAGIETLLVSDPSNMAWLTGYDGWSFYVHQGVILSLSDDPIWWGRAQDANGALRTVWMEDGCVIAYGEAFVQSTTCHPMQDLARKLSDLDLLRGRLGVEMDNYYFSGKALDSLRQSLPGIELVDTTGMVNWCRTVKSSEELGFMRNAARITEKIIGNIVERVEPGIPKNKLVAQIYADAIDGVDDLWGDYPAIVPLLPSGADASAPHLTWNGKEFATGEATFFEISGCYRRYHSPMSRTVFLGKPPAHLINAEQALITGLEAGLEAAKAGNRASDIAKALKNELRKAGIDRQGRVGYPTGLSYPPDWGERTISLREDDDSILEPGMTFHFMPGLWMSDWGLEITETIAIRETGPAECLASVPRKLFIKD